MLVCPAGQGWQPAGSPAKEVHPARHCVHTAAPAADVLPAGQYVHSAAPPADLLPAGHSSQPPGAHVAGWLPGAQVELGPGYGQPGAHGQTSEPHAPVSDPRMRCRQPDTPCRHECTWRTCMQASKYETRSISRTHLAAAAAWAAAGWAAAGWAAASWTAAGWAATGWVAAGSAAAGSAAAGSAAAGWAAVGSAAAGWAAGVAAGSAVAAGRPRHRCPRLARACRAPGTLPPPQACAPAREHDVHRPTAPHKHRYHTSRQPPASSRLHRALAHWCGLASLTSGTVPRNTATHAKVLPCEYTCSSQCTLVCARCLQACKWSDTAYSRPVS